MKPIWPEKHGRVRIEDTGSLFFFYKIIILGTLYRIALITYTYISIYINNKKTVKKERRRNYIEFHVEPTSARPGGRKGACPRPLGPRKRYLAHKYYHIELPKSLPSGFPVPFEPRDTLTPTYTIVN